MNNKLLYIVFSVFVTSFFGCDKIDDPLVRRPDGGNNPIVKDSVIKKILIEDFTGHQCGNCPRAAEVAQQLQDIYGKKLVVVAIHVGWFARTINDPSGKFSTDFRTPAGDAYNQLWKNDAAGLPNGFVNRSLLVNNTIIVNHSSWGQAIEITKDDLPEVELDVKVEYNSSNRSLKANVKTIGLKPVSGKYQLVLYLVEDNVVDWQKDYSLPSGSQDIKDYNHRHVLRDNINGTWGSECINGLLAVGDTLSNEFNYSINPNWNDANCSVVAYLYNTDTYEIIQVEEVYIKK
jgi:thiol-disulfide isomerase/thioredoxin